MRLWIGWWLVDFFNLFFGWREWFIVIEYNIYIWVYIRLLIILLDFGLRCCCVIRVFYVILGIYWLLKLLLLNGVIFYFYLWKVFDIVCYLYIVYEVIVF